MKLKLLKPYGSGYVAFSGGGDSTALVHSLLDRNREVELLFFNHGIKEDDEAEKHSLDFAKEHGLKIHLGHIGSVGFFGGFSVEEHWRKERYEFFSKFNDSPIFLGHHFDDVLETYCQSFFTGNPKLIPFKHGENIYRPLLDTDKKQILEFLKFKGVSYIDCVTNKDVRFSRNRVRHVLLPILEGYDPHLRNTIKRKLRKSLL
jgi:tRNA(Ile)-lysidine synthase